MFLEWIFEEIGELSLAVIFDGDDIVYIVCFVMCRIMLIGLGVGSCFFVYCIVLGWVILVF